MCAFWKDSSCWYFADWRVMNAEGIFPFSAAKLIIQVKFNLEMEVEGGDGTGQD